MKIKNIVLASALVAGGMFVINVQAQSTVVTVGGVNYAIALSPSAVTAASYSSTLVNQPTFGNQTLANQLAVAVGSTLGFVNPGLPTNNGPFFVYSWTPGSVGQCFFTQSGGVNCLTGPDSQFQRYWALVTVGGSLGSSIDLTPNAYALRSVYNIQSAALNAGLSYDCNVFDKQGICLSTGGRYSTTNSPETTTTSGLLIGSYKYDKNIRLGAWVDQNLSTNNTDGIKLGNSKPLLGVFGVWSERNDGLGYEVKVSAGYGDKDLEVTRTATNQGSAKVTSKGIQSVSSYGIAIDSNWIAAPYAGVKYVSISRGGYTEGGSNALTYDTLRQETTSAVAGVRFTGKIDPKTFTVLSAGVEHDLDHNVGQYSAGSSNTAVFNQKPQRTRPVVTAGVFYDIDKTQRVGLNAIHRQEAFQTTTSTTALATYTVGF